MTSRILASIVGLTLLAFSSACTSMIKVAPYPDATPWADDVKHLGAVTADSGLWPLSLHSAPPDYTFQSALRAKASSQYGVPQEEIVLGEISVQIGSELDGTIRDWKATAEAGQRKVMAKKARSETESLIELKKLLDAGVITQEEYDEKKKTVLDRL